MAKSKYVMPAQKPPTPVAPPKPYYPEQDTTSDWLRPLGCFGALAIPLLIIFVTNLPK